VKVTLNRDEMELNVEGFNILGDILQDIREKRFAETEFISSISINGEEVGAEKLAGLENRPLSGITSIEIKTDNPRDISLRVLSNMSEFLEHLITLINQSADKFRLDDESEANKHFIGCVEGLQTFVSVLDKIKNLNKLDFSAITYESTPVSEKQERLLKVFNSLHNTQKIKDWISIADLLEYELSPLISDWKQILPIVYSEVEKR
jgi:hypothetical protein